MLAAFEQMASGNAKGGFPLSRICCRMDWAVEDRSYVDDLIEFESRVNDVWTRHEDAVICTYHLGKFWRRHGDRHHADTSTDHYRRHSPAESVFCTAHELNQPLSGIVTNASTCMRMLAADSSNVDGARETARRTIRDGNRASEMITRLRALFTKKSATTQSMDLNEATREVIALSLSELQKNRVILQPELARDLRWSPAIASSSSRSFGTCCAMLRMP
jgi:DcmR-like sensory protein